MKKKFMIFIIIALSFFIIGCNKKELAIKLEGNPTTGYEWTYTVSQENIISISEKYFASSNLTGAGGIYTYKIKGLKEGNTNILFTYKRSWEESENDQTKIYHVEVDKDLNVKLK